MKITVDKLKKLNVCEAQITIFAKEWPDGAEVSETNIKRAIDIGLDIDWLAGKKLRGQALAEYKRATAPALAEYQRAIDQALAEYKRATAPALAEYKRAIAPCLAEYKRAIDQALAEYKRAIDQAQAEYERVCGMAFLSAVSNQERRQENE